MRRFAVLCLFAAACSSGPGTAPTPTPQMPSTTSGGKRVRVLMLTTTAGFRHEDAIKAARALMSALVASSQIAGTVTEDLSAIGPSMADNYDVLFFALTSGELPFTPEQRNLILSFMNRGGGFIGVHSATDTLYEWPEYGRLVGAYFKEHPWTQRADVIVENQSHPATTGLGERFSLNEEFYTFRENPRPHVQVLLRLDAASVGSSGDYPLAWTQSYGSGRVYYNALGHFGETWNDPRFQRQILGAIQWTANQ